ncbi:alpha-2-macroglobulin-like protein [Plakobranchus ocellatus]|uniref:Alpha-2-macroglobulin-like protein n=1 Tax=Plakobranchus ocellatus TaxID=259542 RepID=A0AAV4CWN8_9GAST|nr:alpha-2-macroglobulin-like protein [Plakobranchus ocellatus]
MLTSLKPTTIRVDSIHIRDPLALKVKQYSNLTTRGVSILSFQLGSQARPGKWTIEVNPHNKAKRSKIFKVYLYILASFGVIIISYLEHEAIGIQAQSSPMSSTQLVVFRKRLECGPIGGLPSPQSGSSLSQTSSKYLTSASFQKASSGIHDDGPFSQTPYLEYFLTEMWTCICH